MKKACVSAVMVFVFLLSQLTVFADVDYVIVDYERAVEFEWAYPFITEQGVIMLPLRAIFESLGFEVDWDESTQAAIITSPYLEITARAGDYFVTINGTPEYLEEAAILKINERMFIPAGLFGLAANSIIYWWEDYSALFIYTPAFQPHPTFEPPAGSDILDFSGDAAILVYVFEQVHPSFITPSRLVENFAQISEEFLEATAQPMAFAEFNMAVQRFLAYFGDGHLSRTFQSLTAYGTITLFQYGSFLDVFFIARENGFFLAESAAGPIKEYRVLEIGGVPVEAITALIDIYYGRYNQAGQLRNHGRYARYELILRMAGVEIEEGQVTLTLENDGVVSTIQAGFIPYHPSRYRLTQYQPERFASHEMMGDVFYINLGFTNFDESVLEALEATREALDAGVRNFIIDLRATPGGNPEVGYMLLEAMGLTIPQHGKILRIGEHNRDVMYAGLGLLNHVRYFQYLNYWEAAMLDLVYVPRNPYNANPYGVTVVALTSDRTFSGGTTIAVTIADSDFGIVIGEPSATSPSYYGWGFNIVLPESFLIVRPHISFYLRPDATADPHVLWPDIHVDAWEALDVALEFFN